MLPTDPLFQELTSEQIDWILKNIELDNKELIAAQKGKQPNEQFEDYEEEWYNTPEKYFDPVKENHKDLDIENIMNKYNNKIDIEKYKAKFDNLEEWNEFLASGNKSAIDIGKEQLIQENLEKAFKEAKEIEELGGKKPSKEIAKVEKLDTGLINKAVELFEQGENEIITQQEEVDVNDLDSNKIYWS